MRSVAGSLIFIVILIAVDFYVFQAVKQVSLGGTPRTRFIISLLYWLVSAAAVLFFLSLPYLAHYSSWQKPLRTYVFATLMALIIAKIVAVPFFLIDDFRRAAQWIMGRFSEAGHKAPAQGEEGISRSIFLSWLGLGVGSVLLGSLLYGFRNQYNYSVKKIKLSFGNLPAAFKGLRIIQISDIHSGSFMDKEAVEKGIALINEQQPDLILFTGDLVNDRANEMHPFIDSFSQLRAPMGVYSTLGNHDYGDYVAWPDRNEQHLQNESIAGRRLLTPLQQGNLDELMQIHAQMGWQLLNDEHVVLEREAEKIALIGVQNISGKGRFHTYGDLQKAHEGSAHIPFKILMSHDPSHWDSEVLKQFSDVDLTLAGHTHGMQFGVELPGFKWSPVKWMYKRWAGLYEVGQQKLYVNRGFGFIGYPGRVGILPEITVIELV